jgi:site-specific recombinase XerD
VKQLNKKWQSFNQVIKGGLNMDKSKSVNGQSCKTGKKNEKKTNDSFRQNASFAEKNLLNESIFSHSDDKYDIKAITRKKVENMLELDDIQFEEAPLDYKNFGRKGIIEWIWKNKIMVEIPSTFLKSYLNKKKKIDAMSFYKYYKLVLELSQQVAIFQQIPIDKVSDSDILNEKSFNFLLENFALTHLKKQMIKSIYSNVQGTHQVYQIFTSSLSNKTERKVQKKTLHPKVIEFLKQMEKDGKAEGTKQNFIRYMNMFLPWLSHNIQDFRSYEVHEIPTYKIKEIHLCEFRSYLLKKERCGEYARITIAECLYALRQFFQFLKRKYGFPNPARKLKSIKAPRYKYRDLPTDEQITTFLKVISQYSDYPVLERVAFRLMFSLGLRSIEVARLTWNDINLATKTIRIHGKGDRYDLLPLVEQLYEELQILKQSETTSQYLLGNNINKNLIKLQENYKLYSLIAGWEFEGGLHLFRHIFITKKVKQGVLLQELKELARVEKEDTVGLYTHINRKGTWLNEQINKLNYIKEEDNYFGSL